ncbi:MAG: hypothetical protein NT056_01750, partial [Proteobacteria bacterium]|nr:hypothetical protein [Pseudomonadota bacterium]
YYLALYMVEPHKYENAYVDNFPTESSGVMVYLYDNIELKDLTPHFLYSIDSIGDIALKGNEKAIEKVFIGYTQTDGVVAENFSDIIAKLFKNDFNLALNVLSKQESFYREKVIYCLNELTPEEFKLLRDKVSNIKTKNKNKLILIKEILNFKYKYEGVVNSSYKRTTCPMGRSLLVALLDFGW